MGNANVARINLEIKNCYSCPFIRYDKDTDIWKCVQGNSEGVEIQDTFGVPDNCNFVLQRLRAVVDVIDGVSSGTAPKKWLNMIHRKQRDDPDPKFGADHSFKHAEAVCRIGTKFLSDCAKYGFLDPNSLEKTQLMLTIAAKMHDVGLADQPRSHAIHSAELTKKLLADKKKIDIDERDAIEIVHAISDHSDGYFTDTILDAALILADKLNVTSDRVERVTDAVIGEMQKIFKVEYKFVGKPGKVTGIELRYTTGDDFDIVQFARWKKAILVPRDIAINFLKVGSFKFFVNDQEIDIKTILK